MPANSPAPPDLPLLVLASSSPRRRQLLADAGYEFEVIPPDESAEADLPASLSSAELVGEFARRKADDVARRLQTDRGAEEIVLVAADTVAECGGRILGKPTDVAEARAMLRMLSGTEHRVLTGLCVGRLGKCRPSFRPTCVVEATSLRMEELSDPELEAYLATGAWRGKAGGFGFQDGLGWVHIVAGSTSNVVGLPMERLAELLAVWYPEGFGVE